MTANMNLKITRQLRGLTQLELAHAVGVKEMKITQFETRRRLPTEKEAQAIARVLGKQVDELFDEVKQQ